MNRRLFVARSSAILAGVTFSERSKSRGAESDETSTHQATGTRVGEMTPHSAVVWTRLTARSDRNDAGRKVANHSEDLPEVKTLEGACPGMAGRVRLLYSTREDLHGAEATDWAQVDESTDFIHKFLLTDLKPSTVYHYASETPSFPRAFFEAGSRRLRIPILPPRSGSA